MTQAQDDWLEPEDDQEQESDDFLIGEYDLTSTPNDFNVRTIVDFIQRGVFEIPSFQRNYVWDIRRASKLIESIVIGLPIPQIFLYEKARNKFLVIDGQQRLMSIFYYEKMRFPRIEKRGSLRRIYDTQGQLPDDILANDAYFVNFNLDLPSKLPSQRNRLHGINYKMLGEDLTTFELRTIRCVVVKQNAPKGDDSSVYEIFHRLNTGGVNLTPQEIRTSLYHSDFYKLLYRLNARPDWRRIIDQPEPDLRMRDVEVLLRGFAMLLQGESYSPSMTRFLNQFSNSMKNAKGPDLQKLEEVFDKFLDATQQLAPGAFGTRARKLKVSVFEAAFATMCRDAWVSSSPIPKLSEQKLTTLKTDPEFVKAASHKSTDTSHVNARLKRARVLLLDGKQGQNGGV